MCSILVSIKNIAVQEMSTEPQNSDSPTVCANLHTVFVQYMFIPAVPGTGTVMPYFLYEYVPVRTVALLYVRTSVDMQVYEYRKYNTCTWRYLQFPLKPSGNSAAAAAAAAADIHVYLILCTSTVLVLY